MENTSSSMDISDIWPKLIRLADSSRSLLLEYAANDAGHMWQTPPRHLVECYYIRSGSWAYHSKGLERHLQAGDVLVCNAHFGNAATTTDPQASYACMSLIADQWPASGSSAWACAWHVHQQAQTIIPAYNALVNVFHTSQQSFVLERQRAAILNLLILLSDNTDKPAHIHPSQNQQAARIMAWLCRQRLDRPLDLQPLCQELAVTTRHVNRLFTQYFHKTPKQLHMRQRLDRALHLIASRRLSVKETAHQLGFQDSFYFSRIFKQTFGFPPSASQDHRPVH